MAQQSAREVVSRWQKGTTSIRYETGGRGVTTISNGKGDNGGPSYGAYQLSSTKGALNRYLKDRKYGNYLEHFGELKPGSTAFNEKWVEIAKNDPNFAMTQHQFISDTHYDVLIDQLKLSDLDLRDRGIAVQDMIWSTSVQFGPKTTLVKNALVEKFGAKLVLESLSDADLIAAVQEYKVAHNESLFKRSSEEIRRGTLSRAKSEKDSLLNLLSIEKSAKNNPDTSVTLNSDENAADVTVCSFFLDGAGGSFCLSYENQTGNSTSAFDPIFGYSDDPATGMPWPGSNWDELPDQLKAYLRQAEKSISPLVLDLDGDGVETISKSRNGVYFDLDISGFSEQTGWAAKDDGLLARDINGDGNINNGGELFGNYTALKNGQLASNGFEALKDLDNNVDGVIDAKDSAFTTLRLWRDLNSNGATDGGELQTLEQANVRNLNVGYTSGNQKDAEGNHHRQLGSFTKGDGRQQKMDDVWFSVDTARTMNMKPLAVSAQIDALPELPGMGNVASLHQAMAQDSTGTLTKLVQQWLGAGDADRPALLNELIFHWAGVQNSNPASRAARKTHGDVIGDVRRLETLEKFLGTNYAGNWSWGEQSNPYPEATFHAAKAFDLLAQRIKERLQWQSDFRPFVNNLAFRWNAASAGFEWDVSKLVLSLQTQFARGEAPNRLSNFYDASIRAESGGASLMVAFWNALAQQSGDFKTWLLLDGTTFLPGTDGADTLVADDNDKPHLLLGGAGDDTLRGGSGSDILTGDSGNDSLLGGLGGDTYLFNKGDGTDIIYDFDYDYIIGNIDTLRLGPGLTATNTILERTGNRLTLTWGTDSISVETYFDITAAFQIEQFVFADGTTWSRAEVAANLTQMGSNKNDGWRGFDDQSNRMFGLAGNDDLSGGQLADTIDGGDGDDQLIGYDGSDTLIGGNGNDTLYGGYGNNSLAGGKGNDRLIGDTGHDTYLFNQGDGVDTIRDYDPDSGSIDMLRLGEGLTAAKAVLERSINDIILTWGTDSVVIESYFYFNHYRIEQVIFSNGTIWTCADIASRLTQTGTNDKESWWGFRDQSNRMFGLEGEDELYGGQLADVLDGGDGNDYLFGYAGNDTLTGGNGNDILDGGEGNDSFAGGKGDDRLVGGKGNDTYLFNRGDGADIISDYDPTSDNIDTLRLGKGLTVVGAVLTRSNDDIILTWGIDSITVANYFTVAAYNFEKIIFADGTTWGCADLAAKLTQTGSINNDDWRGFSDQSNRMFGLTGNDHLYGGKMADTIDGGDGTDTLDGGEGNDTLAGGKGNDSLVGGSGNDTYLFNRGDGIDTIKDYDNTSGNTDTLRLGTGLTAAKTVLARSGDDLTLTWGSDSVLIQNFFYFTSYKIEKIAFSNGTTWGYADIAAKLTQTGTIGSDQWWGLSDQSNRMVGLAGDDQFYGGQLADTLDGGEGNDAIFGRGSSDTLIGGKGNDVLDGADGNDTYRFRRGDGIDTILDSDTTNGNLDVLELSGINQQNLWFKHTGNDLQISVLGSSDQIIVKDWYATNQGAGSNHIERIKTAEGYTLHDSDVEKFVEAMAGFAAPSASQTSWTNGQQSNGRVLLSVTH